MTYQPFTSTLTGPEGAGWAQVHDLGGGLVVVLGLTDSRLEQVARNIVQRFQKNEQKDNLLILRKISEEFSEHINNIELGLINIKGDVVNVACWGGGSLYLFRGGRFVKIISGSSAKVLTASGKIKEGDMLLLATNSFFRMFSIDSIKSALSSGNPVESLAPALHVGEDTSSVGAAFVSVGSQSAVATARPLLVVKPRLRLAGAVDALIKKLPERKLVVRSEVSDLGSPQRRTAAFVGVMLLGLLGVSIFFGIRQRASAIVRSKYESKLTQASHEFEEAKSLSGLNNSRARELMLSARGIVLGLADEGIEDPEIDNLTAEIQNNLGAIAGIYESGAEMFLDLTLISNGFSGEGVVASDGVMRVLDKESQKLVSVEIVTKKTNVIAGSSDLFGAFDLAAYSDRHFVLSDDGIREVGDEVILSIKPEWPADNILLGAFAGNIYVLDREENNLWRYIGVSNGFLEAEDWLAPGIRVSFEDAHSWAIDGSIWILDTDGKIQKYTRGVPERVELIGLDLPLGQDAKIYTDEEAEFLYILDSANSRIVVVDKDGQYKAEYFSEEFSRARGFVVSEAEKKIVFLTGDKLWEIPLRHMD